MPGADPYSFTDFAGRRWSCRLTAAFWFWFGAEDRSGLNMCGILYAALHRQAKEYGLTPQECAVAFACPDALKAFVNAVKEWCDV